MSAKSTNRIWLDTAVLANIDLAKMLPRFWGIVRHGSQFVIANTILDVKAFQENIPLLEMALREKYIVIEIWNTPDEMTSKEFFWSSCQMTTPASASFIEAIASLPNKNEILAIKSLIEKYGIPKGKWEQGKYSGPKELSAEAATILGIEPTTNRTKVLLACKDQDRMDIFDEFNLGYNAGIAHQHLCDKMLLTDGSIREI